MFTTVLVGRLLTWSDESMAAGAMRESLDGIKKLSSHNLPLSVLFVQIVFFVRLHVGLSNWKQSQYSASKVAPLPTGPRETGTCADFPSARRGGTEASEYQL